MSARALANTQETGKADDATQKSAALEGQGSGERGPMSSMNSPQGGGTQLQQQEQSTAVQTGEEDQQTANAKVPKASGKRKFSIF